jgi:hypothetical protein
MKKLAFLGIFQIAAILAWAGYHEHVRLTAPTFRIPLQLIDPYDILRGRYFVLNPTDSWMKTGESSGILDGKEVSRFLGRESSYRGPALVGFCPLGGLQRVCALARLSEKPPDSALFWSRALVTIYWEESSFRGGAWMPAKGWRVQVDLGLGRFFLPNRVRLPAGERESGWELEVSHRVGLAPLPRRLFFRGKPVDVAAR